MNAAHVHAKVISTRNTEVYIFRDVQCFHSNMQRFVIKGGGSRGATGALAPPIAKVGGLSPPKIEVNAPPTYFELRHCYVEMAGSRDVCS